MRDRGRGRAIVFHDRPPSHFRRQTPSESSSVRPSFLALPPALTILTTALRPPSSPAGPLSRLLPPHSLLLLLHPLFNSSPRPPRLRNLLDARRRFLPPPPRPLPLQHRRHPLPLPLVLFGTPPKGPHAHHGQRRQQSCIRTRSLTTRKRVDSRARPHRLAHQRGLPAPPRSVLPPSLRRTHSSAQDPQIWESRCTLVRPEPICR